MFWLHRLNPANAFRKNFELVLAETTELREEVYRLRHKVYCEELGFEAINAERREQDEYDERSRHLLLRCVRTGSWVGCIRLVLTPHDRPDLPLPSETIRAAPLDRRSLGLAGVPRQYIAEVSRLALAPEYRRRPPARKRESAAPTDLGKPTHAKAPYLRLSLYLGAIALAHRLGIEAVLFLTEPRLAAHLRTFGFPFRQVGDPVEYRGTRVLSMARLDDPVRSLPYYLRSLYRVVEREIADDLAYGPVSAGFRGLAKRHARIGARHFGASTAATG
jgi:N-acyl amino acid synthase of PEP-CTERM/exosortase system